MRVHPAIAYTIIGALGLMMIVLIAGVGGTTGGTHPTAPPPVTAAVNVPPTATRQADDMPSDQSALIRVVSEARAKYKSAANDMAKGAARVDRKQAICAAISGVVARNWKGKIATLSSNNDGRGVLSIQIGPQVYVHTWNNALSDYGDHTLIDPSSSLYSAAMKMSVGTIVHFDGTFITSNEDCLKDTSITMDGSMTQPEFLFRFDAVESSNNRSHE